MKLAAVTKDPRNAEKLCAGGFTEADYNQAYAEWCYLTKYNSDSDSEFNAEEYAAAHPNRNYTENPNAAYGLGDVDELDLAEIEPENESDVEFDS